MKGVQCYELFGGIALKINTFSFFSYVKLNRHRIKVEHSRACVNVGYLIRYCCKY